MQSSCCRDTFGFSPGERRGTRKAAMPNKTVNPSEKDGLETELGYGTTEHGFVDSKTFRPTSIKKRFPKLYEDISAAVKHF